MPYTGNLMRLQQSPVARKLPGPSPRHGQDEGDPEIQRGQSTVPGGTGSEFGGTDFPQTVMAGGGVALDTPASWAGNPPGGSDETPYHITYPDGNPHDSDAVLSNRAACSQKLTAEAHDGAEDRGWWRTTFSASPMFMAIQEKLYQAFDGLAQKYNSTSDDRMLKHLRGINSLPENNPEGFRYGVDRVRAWDGDAAHHVTRDFGLQMLQPRDVYTPLPYRKIPQDMFVTPAIPKDPGLMDEQQLADSNYNSSPSSVFGGF